jgi:hypothetical protein
MFVSVCTDTLLYLTWMPDCGSPVRIVMYYSRISCCIYVNVSAINLRVLIEYVF